MKIVTYFLLVSLLSFCFVFTKASAANEGIVAATVTAQNIALTVGDGSIAYGILAVNTSLNTNSLSDTQTITNTGNVTQNFNIKGTNSANWTLGSNAGSETYVHKFCTASCSVPANYTTTLTTNYAQIASSIAPAGTQTFDLQITTPTDTTNFTQQNVDVTVQATI